nr:GGDEF domain-containing protein [Methylobacterium sp. L1A1]
MLVPEGYKRSGVWFDHWSARTTWIVLAASTGALIGIDRAFPLVGMGPAYIPLIALAGWRLGLAPACLVALGAAFLNIFPNHVAEAVPLAVALARGILRLSTYAFIVALTVSLRRSYERERAAAQRDDLTGALARAAFDERAAAMTSLTAQGRNALAVVVIDVDGFKGINDRHGHAAGDDTLRALATSAAAALSKNDCLGRLGGDEFAAILCAATVSEAHHRVEALHRALSEGLARAEVAVTVSMGACILGSGALADVAAVMRDADRSMYNAKASGPGAYRIGYPATR